METDGRPEQLAPKLLSRHARPHSIGLRVGVSEDEA